MLRVDGSPTLPQHVEALVEYIRTEVEPLMKKAVEDIELQDPVATREEILKQITRSNFERFFEEYKKIKIRQFASHTMNRLDWSLACSPYAAPTEAYYNMVRVASAGTARRGQM